MLSQEKSMQLGKTNYWFWAAVALLIILHIGKAGLFIAAGQPPLEADAAGYWRMTDRMLHGDLALVAGKPNVDRTPGYPLFLMPFQAFAARHALATATIAQELLVVAVAMATSWMCWRITKARLSVLLSLTISLFCVSQNSVAQHLLSDTLLCFFVTLSIACVIAWFERPNVFSAIGVGILLGAATLVKPVAQLAWVPIAAVMIMQIHRMSSNRIIRRSLPHLACLVAAMLVVLSPWMLRNQVYCGRPFLVKYLGANMWWSLFKSDVNHPTDPAIPFADTPRTRAMLAKLDGVDLHRHHLVRRKLESLGYSDCEIDDLMTAVCWDAIKEHPSKYLASRCRRFAWFWLTPNGTFRPCTGVYRSLLHPTIDIEAEEEKGSYYDQEVWHGDWYFKQGGLNWLWHPHPLVYMFAALVTATCVIGLICSRRLRIIGVLLGLMFLYFSVVIIVTACPEYRYRMILEPLMVLAVTTGLVAAFQRHERPLEAMAP
jgi:4-amino-4-deoxy-L-arabinose transferase-like glycosyltransferase